MYVACILDVLSHLCHMLARPHIPNDHLPLGTSPWAEHDYHVKELIVSRTERAEKQIIKDTHCGRYHLGKIFITLYDQHCQTNNWSGGGFRRQKNLEMEPQEMTCKDLKIFKCKSIHMCVRLQKLWVLLYTNLMNFFSPSPTAAHLKKRLRQQNISHNDFIC